MRVFRHTATLNTVGVIVLFVGICSAALVYRLDQKSAPTSITNGDWKDSTLSLTDSKTSTRNIELYGGKVEVLMVKLQDWLQHPESMAILISTISALIAAGCFLAARYLSANRFDNRRRSGEGA